MTMQATQKAAAGMTHGAAKPKVQRDTLQWLLAFVFLLLLLAHTLFSKPMLALVLIVYLPFVFTSLGRSIALVRPFSFAALWLLFMASYFWSVVPKVSLDLILTLSAFTVLAIFITLHHRAEGFAKPLRLSAILLLILVVLYCAFFPGAAVSGAHLIAFYHQKNNFGVMMGLSAMVLFHAPDRNRWHVGFGLLALALLAASLSKTPIALVVVCSILLPLADRWVKRFYSGTRRALREDMIRPLLYPTALFGLVALVVFRDQFLDLLWTYFTKSMLTDRGTLWLTVVQQIRGHSLLGIGPGTFWDAQGASQIAQTIAYKMDPIWVQNLGSADGSYIDLMASIGVLGLALFLLTAIDLYRRLLRNWHQPDSRLMFVLTTFVLLHAVTETTLLASTNVLWFLYLLCYFRVVGYANFNPATPQRSIA